MTPFWGALARSAVLWTAVLFALNLAWEFAQLPLYSMGPYAGWPWSAYAVVHCTLGDAMIALASYAVAAALVRSADWPAHRPVAGGAVAIAVSLAYTVWAEWRNVYLLGSWAYSSSMPTIGGIGVSPLMQWIVLPALGLLLIRRARARGLPGDL